MPRIVCSLDSPGRPRVPTSDEWGDWQRARSLTETERTVLALLEQNRTTREIAGTCNIAPREIVAIFHQIRRKLAPPWSDTVV
jgi:DNA-binding NarL/FixJ family response regulator